MIKTNIKTSIFVSFLKRYRGDFRQKVKTEENKIGKDKYTTQITSNSKATYNQYTFSNI